MRTKLYTNVYTCSSNSANRAKYTAVLIRFATSSKLNAWSSMNGRSICIMIA